MHLASCVVRWGTIAYGLKNWQLSCNSSRNEATRHGRHEDIGGWLENALGFHDFANIFHVSRKIAITKRWMGRLSFQDTYKIGKKFRASWKVIKGRIDSATGLRKRQQAFVNRLSKQPSLQQQLAATTSLTPSPIFSSFLYVSMISTRPQMGRS